MGSTALSVVLVFLSAQQGAWKLSVVENVTQPAPNTMIYVGSVYHLLRQPLSQHVLPCVPKLSNKVSVIQAVMLSPAYVVRVYRKQLHHHHHNALQDARKLYRQVTVTSLVLPTLLSVVNVSHPHHS